MDDDGGLRRPARPAGPARPVRPAFDPRQERTLNILRRATPPPAGEAPDALLGAVSSQMAASVAHQEQQYLERQLRPITQAVTGMRAEFDQLKVTAPNRDALVQRWAAAIQALKAKQLDPAQDALSRLNAEMAIARQAPAPVIPVVPAAVVPAAGAQAHRPPLRPTRALRPASILKSKFDVAALDKLRNDTDRGFIKGTGDFGKLLDEAKKFMTAPALTAPDAEIQRIQAVVDKAQAYLAARPAPADGSPRKFGDDKGKLKITSAESLLLEARRLQLDLIDPRFANHAAGQPGQREQAAQGRAAAMAKVFGARKAAGGTSDVQLIKGSEGEVAYAFKSVNGETHQTGMAKGSAAVREALASAAADAIRAQTGLDFGFPQISLVTLGGQQGALIEGIKGDILDGGALSKLNLSGKVSDTEFVATKKRWTAMAEKVPAKQLQKVLLSNLATAQFDIKWDNIMLDEDASGTITARPFDAGAAFPTDDLFEGFMARGGRPGGALMENPGDDSKPPSVAHPMDDELATQFLQIDVAAIKATLDAERLRLAQVHGLDPGLLDDRASQRAIQSILIVQDLLKANKTITLEGLVNAYEMRLGELR